MQTNLLEAVRASKMAKSSKMAAAVLLVADIIGSMN